MKTIFKSLIFSCTFLFVSTLAALAQTPAPAASEPGANVAILAGRLIDVRSGHVTTNAYIVVEKDRIVRIVNAAPAGVKVIDLSKYTVVPGLIDCHAHLLGNPKDQSAMSGLRMSSAQGAIWGVHNATIWLDHGFTALRDAGESDIGYGQLAVRDSINRGLIRGPRMVSAGNFVSITGGHGDADLLAPDKSLPRAANMADTVDQVSVAVRRDIKFGADWIKLMATGGVMDPISDYTVQELSQEQMAKAVEVAHRAGKKVMAHAEGAEGIKAAVRAGVDSIEHGTEIDDDVAKTMARGDAALVSTLSVFASWETFATTTRIDRFTGAEGRQRMAKRREGAYAAVAAARRAGVRIATGSDFGGGSVRAGHLAWEVELLVGAGLEPYEALAAATWRGGEVLGVDHAGRIEEGMPADLVLVHGDPLSDPRALWRVWAVYQGGERVA